MSDFTKKYPYGHLENSDTNLLDGSGNYIGNSFKIPAYANACILDFLSTNNERTYKLQRDEGGGSFVDIATLSPGEEVFCRAFAGDTVRFVVENGSASDELYSYAVGLRNDGDNHSSSSTEDFTSSSSSSTLNSQTSSSSSSLDWQNDPVLSGSLSGQTSLGVFGNNVCIAHINSNDLDFARFAGGIWSATSVDEGTSGPYISMSTINDRPAISYYDASSGDLKYARRTELYSYSSSSSTVELTSSSSSST